MTEFIDVNATNLDRYGFFCMRSKPKNAGHQNKRLWLQARFNDGLKLKIVQVDGKQKGFIEYIPGAFTWRAIDAKDYMAIHCFWVVGKNKGKGYGSTLLNLCIEDALAQGLRGVAIVTSEKGWLPNKQYFEKKGFHMVDQIDAFQLMVLDFDQRVKVEARLYNWKHTAEKYQEGVTVFTSDQCPFNQDAVDNVQAAGDELGIDVQIIHLDDYESAQQQSPIPYGTFCVIYNGKIITYHPETKNKYLKLLS
ncbi:GNAT family N-acetyltransferase [Paraliobacillus ryukyuensis]|uniref:GNAT family N-acetyltransferase n=1 Tax=Paraliobacillus ryukyuensis TaxID=200904 RepID=UPI0009A69A7B|nr:GNAT family N-acetyltransferase [Paraliobacillus ryukyuensis]